MKTIYKYLSLAVIGCSLASCNDWLDDVKSTTTVDDVTVWQYESTVNEQVDYFYRLLHGWGQFADSDFNGSLTEALTDVLKYNNSALGARGGTVYQYCVDYNYMSPTQNALSGWSTVYSQVRYANQFLDLMNKYSTFGQEKNDLWEAQVRFFRAYAYFMLAKRYDGGIIYDDLPGMDGNKAMSSKEELWDFIEQDLDYAIEHLPDAWPSGAYYTGRVTNMAAMAFKSRAMLYAERWQKAYDAADAVEKSGKYALTSNYNQSWKGNNSESILQFMYNRDKGPNHQFDQNYAPVIGSNPYEYGATGVPTQEMVESYEAKDGTKVDWTPWHGNPTTVTPPYSRLEPRFAATIVYPGSTYQNVKMDNCEGGVNGFWQEYGSAPYMWNATCTGYYLRKLVDESHTDLVSVKSSQTYVAMRYAEVLLNKAEAAYRLGMMSEAQAAMNQVRARVGLPAKNSSGEQWFNDYRNERKVELAYEGHLYWDMRRWKLAHIEYNDYRQHGFHITTDGTYEYIAVDLDDRKFNEKTYCFPIPVSEVRDNELLNQYPQWL